MNDMHECTRCWTFSKPPQCAAKVCWRTLHRPFRTSLWSAKSERCQLGCLSRHCLVVWLCGKGCLQHQFWKLPSRSFAQLGSCSGAACVRSFQRLFGEEHSSAAPLCTNFV